MAIEKKSGRAEWAKGPLYTFMMKYFPEHRTAFEILDVLRLKDDLNRSHEAIYKWLRSSRLTPQNARAIMELAATEKNAAALAARGIAPPEIREFDCFVY